MKQLAQLAAIIFCLFCHQCLANEPNPRTIEFITTTIGKNAIGRSTVTLSIELHDASLAKKKGDYWKLSKKSKIRDFQFDHANKQSTLSEDINIAKPIVWYQYSLIGFVETWHCNGMYLLPEELKHEKNIVVRLDLRYMGPITGGYCEAKAFTQEGYTDYINSQNPDSIIPGMGLQEFIYHYGSNWIVKQMLAESNQTHKFTEAAMDAAARRFWALRSSENLNDIMTARYCLKVIGLYGSTRYLSFLQQAEQDIANLGHPGTAGFIEFAIKRSVVPSEHNFEISNIPTPPENLSSEALEILALEYALELNGDFQIQGVGLDITESKRQTPEHLMDAIAQKLFDIHKTQNPYRQSSARWLVRALATSENSRYTSILQSMLTSKMHKKVKKEMEKTLPLLVKPSEEQFEPEKALDTD